MSVCPVRLLWERTEARDWDGVTIEFIGAAPS